MKGDIKMKKGDIVMINDGSWSREVRDNKLARGPGNDRTQQTRKQYVVIETGCRFPAYGDQAHSYSYSLATFNNTVIQSLESGRVVFIEERFLEAVKPKHQIMVNVDCTPCRLSGKIVEISDDLYQEIKRETEG